MTLTSGQVISCLYMLPLLRFYWVKDKSQCLSMSLLYYDVYPKRDRLRLWESFTLDGTHIHTPITLRHYLNQRLGFPMILCQCCLKEARESSGHAFQPDLCKEKNKHCKLPMGKQESTTIC
ncbi:hypothetical protein QQF64_035546 [Cirrhinus molitorella]|uniref:Uncharacterized protein n=1 Tax=Cirrhinus molitorella TaxID=172907 RepID=A0ABR3NG41_9TELE